MEVDTWLKKAAKQLETAGIGTARLDVLVLLEDVTGRDRAWLLAHPEFELTAAHNRKLTNLLSQRAQHTPLAYVRGRTEFYGREFLITPAVLEPRPESETMIDLLKKLPIWTQKHGAKTSPIRIADVGAGSGALGITAKLELPAAEVDLIELDPKALEVAKTNVDKFTLSMSVIESDLLARTTKDYDLLLCNLPYVPDDFTINPAALQEPRLAIFGGPDGLDLYRKLFKQIGKARRQPLYFLSEALPPQHDALQQIAKSAGYELETSEDLIQVFRDARAES